MDKYQTIAERVVALLGSPTNIVEVENCITRMRVEVRDVSAVDLAGLKAVEGVLGIVPDASEIQVVLGPGAVDKVTAVVERMIAEAGPVAPDHGAAPDGSSPSDAARLAEQGASMKASQKKKNDTPFKRLLRQIANIFVPLIPALIGAGIIAGINGLLINLAKDNDWTAVLEWTPAIGVIATGFMGVALPVMVAFNAAKEFGGTPVLGAALGAIVVSPAIATVPAMLLFGGATIPNPEFAADPTLAETIPLMLAPGQGGVLGAMFAAILGAYIERWCRRWAPDSISMLVVPTVTLLLAGAATVLVLISAAGEITTWIGDGANWLLEQAGALAGFVLGGLFLPLVMLGLHQALIPIHATLIEQEGYTTLLPILAMAGAGQVGAAIAVYRRLRRNRSMRTVIRSALPAGFLGVGEPLIYGVSLPLGRPFITACVGGAFGGAFVGLADQIGYTVGAKAIGPSGWALFPLLDGEKGIGWAALMYAIGLLIGYVAGFVATYFFGFSAQALVELNDEDGTPAIEAVEEEVTGHVGDASGTEGLLPLGKR